MQPMSTNLPATENDNKYVIMYSVDIMKARIFGAFLCAAEHRRNSDGFTRKMLADFIGKDEGSVSKLFTKPSNMTIKTVTELCEALNVEFQFALVDRTDARRVFLDVGMKCRHIHPAQDIVAPKIKQYTDNFVVEIAGSNAKKIKNHKNWISQKNMVAAPLFNYVTIEAGPNHDDS